MSSAVCAVKKDFTLFGVRTLSVWIRKLYAKDHAKFCCSQALMKDLEIELTEVWAGTNIYHSSKTFPLL